ncbi:MAG TPA: hypothetical protein VFS20_15840 [Longimicrobium sp.]|nr:hypothetical protein [Longimicrobium sp.]
MDIISDVTPLSGLTIATGEPPEACAACGAPAGECRCARLRDALHQRAAALQRAGLAAAREGELHRAFSLLRRAVALAALDARAARVLGMVALCLGEIEVAARALRSAGTDGPAVLEAASVRDALRLYNEALAEAQAGNRDAAESRVGEALEHLPDLVPAHRLRALLAAERGDEPGARAACEAGLAMCRDDLLLQRCLASLATPAGTMSAAHNPTPAPTAAPPPRPRFITHGAWAATVVAAVVLTRMLGNPAAPAAVEVLPVPPSAPAAAPVSAPASVAPEPAAAPGTGSAAAFDFAAYRRGREAFDRGDWQSAIGELSGAAAVPADAYYRDDALYLLARAQARAARRDDARRTAALLLAGHPASIFANRITRRIAEQGTE